MRRGALVLLFRGYCEARIERLLRLVGRLAVDCYFMQRSLRSALLYEAIRHTMRVDRDVFALVIDSKDEIARIIVNALASSRSQAGR